MKCYSIILIFANLLSVIKTTNNFSIGWEEKGFQFTGCETIFDRRSNVKAKDVKYYNFIFNSSSKYDKFNIYICLDDIIHCRNGSYNTKYVQKINCDKRNNDNQIHCPLITGLIREPLRQNGVLNVTYDVYGVNETKENLVLRKSIELYHCYLGGCTNYAQTVKIIPKSVMFVMGKNQLEYQLEGLTTYSENRFNQLLVSVRMLSNQSHFENILLLNMTENKSLNKNKKFVFSVQNKTCLSKYNKICVATYWDFCQKNFVNRWQLLDHCTEFSYSSHFPTFFLKCDINITNQIHVSLAANSISSVIDPRFFHFNVNVVDENGRKVFLKQTTNMTINTEYQKKNSNYEVSICDKCDCSKNKPIHCPMQTQQVNIDSGDNLGIPSIIGIVISVVFLVVILVFGYFHCKKSTKQQNESQFEGYVQPNNSYTEPDVLDVFYRKHKYLNPVTQEEIVTKVAGF